MTATAVLLALCVVLLLSGAYMFFESYQDVGQESARFVALEQRVATAETHVKTIEARPAAVTDLRPLEQRITAIESKVAALDQKLTAIDQREAAFEQKPPPQASLDAAGRAELAALAGRVDQTVARQNQLGEASQAEAAAVQQRIAAQDKAVAAATRNGAELDQLTTRAAALQAVQGATVALAAGRPLGTIPNAPPALAQFAAKAPPTEPALRLSYPAAAAAAREAGLPPRTDGALLDRMWARAQATITVRQGDRVLVGDPISGVLTHAGDQVDAGDLAGALKTLDQLAGPAAAAMAPWRQQAQSLLDARAALLTMAHG